MVLNLEKNKSEIAILTISIELTSNKDTFKIKIKDEGRDINSNTIRQIVSEKKFQIYQLRRTL